MLHGLEPIKVRLIEIDAPEKAQAFGNKSKQALAALVFGKDVEIEEHGKDKYKRTLGRVVVNGVDANAEMVRQGYAWVYRKYSKTPELLRIEAQAKEAKRGLWADADPIPPWEWRHSGKSPDTHQSSNGLFLFGDTRNVFIYTGDSQEAIQELEERHLVEMRPGKACRQKLF